MSKHNYSQYSNKKKNDSADVKTSPVAITSPKVKMEVELVEETVNTVALPNTVDGVVTNCAKLNVRAEPSTEADVVCVLDAMSEIKIDVTKSDAEWFKVCTVTGVEGYCMRKFVDAYL